MDISVSSLPVQVLPPVNFTLTVSALAQVLLHWEPNPAQEQNNSTIRYDVKILSPVPEEVREKNKPRSLRGPNPCCSLLSKHIWELQGFPLSHPHGHSSAGTSLGNCTEGRMDPGFEYWLPIQLSSLNSPQCLAQALQVPYSASQALLVFI